MYAFAEKPNAIQQITRANAALPAREGVEQSREVNPIAAGVPGPGNDFSRIPATGEARSRTSWRGLGSDALSTETDEAFIGDDGTPTSAPPQTLSTTPAPAPGVFPPSPPVPTPAPGPSAPPPGPSAPPPVAAGPTITSATVKAAPSGAANTRADVGVGEVVNFTGSAAGTWSASAGTPATGASSTAFRWTAPAVTSRTTATITLTAGTQTATKAMTVVPPNSISMRKAGSHTSQIGPGGACMLTAVTFGPLSVCLGAIQTLEVPEDATNVSGFFTKFSTATLHHNPNPDYALVDDNNMKEAGPHNGQYDHCAAHTLPGPYSNGAMDWVIPNRYILDGEAPASGRHFTDTTQHFAMNAAGHLIITKAGASTDD